MTPRALPEWIGKTPDSKPPPHVRARIFDTHGGKCHIAKRKIESGELWDVDHVVALINGGENRESNMAPALRDKHREKTAADVAEKSRVARKRAKHLGIEAKKKPFPGSRASGWSKKMNGEVVRRPAAISSTDRGSGQ